MTHCEDTAATPVLRQLDIDTRTAPALLWRVVRLALRYRGRFALALGASLGASFFNLLMPRLLGRAVDQVQALLRHASISWRALAVTAGLIMAASCLRGLLQMTAGYSGEHIGQSVGRDLRLAFFEKLQRLGFDYHDRVHSGDLITRGMLDLEGVRGFIEMGLQRIISLATLVGIGAVMLVRVDPLLALLSLSFVPFAAWRAGSMGLRLRLAWTRLQERMSVLTRVMEESLMGARVVRAHAAAAHEMARFDVAGNAALALANRRIVTRSGAMAGINFSYYLAMAAVLWVGGQRVTAGTLSIGQLTQFLAFMTLVQQPVRQVGMIANSGARAISSGRRLFEVLDLAPSIAEAPGAPVLAPGPGVLRFEGVSFAYAGSGAGQPALHEVSFELHPGRTLGIIGPSGAGKSTIAQLIPRFYEATSGRITLDGQDIRAVALESLRAVVSVVAQDVFLFDDSVAANVAYADPEAEDRRLTDATATAQLHATVSAMPSGYGTPVGERGAGLSGGQRQRVAIARALVAGARVVVFDDATSAVDAATEHALRAALREATARQATIIISHRLGSVAHADEIIVLDQGRIRERGTHDGLLATGGYYARLHALQAVGAPPVVMEPIAVEKV